MKLNKSFLIKAGCVLFWLVIWQALSVFVGIELLVASPEAVLRVLALRIGESDFWLSILYSMLRVVAGFSLAVVFGTLLAVLTSAVPFLYHLFYPLLTVIKATPVASFIILVLLWVKSSYVPIFISFLMVMPIVWSNIATAIKNTDIKLLEMASVYNFGKLKTIKLIYIPQCIPNFYTSCVMGIGFAWKSAIAAEVISTPKISIGRGLYNSKIYLETPDLFAWTLVVVILSILLEKAFKKLMDKVFKTRTVAKG